MNSFTVWLLLVFIPKLGYIFVPIAILSCLGVCVGVAWLIHSWESLKSEEIANLYKERKIWEKQDEYNQQSCLRGIACGKKLIKTGLISVLISGIIIAGIPSRKEIAAIVLIPYISNNAEFQKIPENLAHKLNELLTDYTENVVKHNEEDK